MIKLTYINSLIFLFLVAGFISCKKDPDPVEPVPVPVTGSVILNFENKFGDSALVLNTGTYITASNDTFSVSKFDYYISNIRLIKDDLSVYAESESYHLLKAGSPGSLLLTLTGVPVGTYTGIEFMIGVDSLRNVSGAQTGALDPSNGMFWSWSTGYIMSKVEGSTVGGTELEFHIGGFKGGNKVLKTVSPSFNAATAIVSETAVPHINISADLAEWFKTPTNIDFTVTHGVSIPGANAKMLADNYADMFSVMGIEN
ncbi:MAG: MbnP family protein [Bacteroidia bacterium]